LKLQSGVCAICREPRNESERKKYLCVDHDHKTGTVRGLLCDLCNTALGAFRERADLAQLGVDYLKAGQTAAVRVVLELV